MEEPFRRINVLVREEQYQRVQGEGLNFSGLVRDLLDDRFSDRRVVLSVSPATRSLYDKAISNFGATDAELEKFLISALDMLLEQKTQEIDSVRRALKFRDKEKPGRK